MILVVVIMTSTETETKIERETTIESIAVARTVMTTVRDVIGTHTVVEIETRGNGVLVALVVGVLAEMIEVVKEGEALTIVLTEKMEKDEQAPTLAIIIRWDHLNP